MAEWKLTKEGRHYLETGLPEYNLMQLLKRPTPTSKAQGMIENFRIALQWAKKHGWVKIEKGKLVPLKAPPARPPELAALEAVSQSKSPTQDMLDILIKRNLVTKETLSVKKAKALAGKEIASLTPELLRTGLWRKVRLKPYNVEALGKPAWPGKRQPYNQFLQLVRRKLIELGFKEMTGPIIETEFWNFDALYQAQDHPSRDWAQTYSLKTPKTGSLTNPKTVSQVRAAHENGWRTGSTGWGYKWDPTKASNLMPRAHSTSCSARQLAAGVEIPGKYFAIQRCFRPDVIDATHGVEFNQCEGIVIDPSLTFRSLLGVLKQFAEELAGAKEVRFTTGYFPFTEPSCELYIKHPQLGWIESGGAGIFRPELTEPLGVKEPVIAWGIGIDRLAMAKLGLTDIRYLFSRDIAWMRTRPTLWR